MAMTHNRGSAIALSAQRRVQPKPSCLPLIQLHQNTLLTCGGQPSFMNSGIICIIATNILQHNIKVKQTNMRVYMYLAKTKPFKKGSAMAKLPGWSSAEAKTPPWGLAEVYDTPIVFLGLRSCCNPLYQSNLNILLTHSGIN